MEGARVVVSSRRAEHVRGAVERLRGEKIEAYGVVVADLTVREDCFRLVGEAARLLGGLDVLVYNTGGLQREALRRWVSRIKNMPRHYFF